MLFSRQSEVQNWKFENPRWRPPGASFIWLLLPWKIIRHHVVSLIESTKKAVICTKFQVNRMNCVESRRGDPIDHPPPPRLCVTIFSSRLLGLRSCEMQIKRFRVTFRKTSWILALKSQPFKSYAKKISWGVCECVSRGRGGARLDRVNPRSLEGGSNWSPSIFLALNFCSLTDCQKLGHNCSLFVNTSFDTN